MKKELGVLLLLIAITNLPIAQSFDVYFLSLTWPNSYCNVKTAPCQPPVPQNFTIHGLWPGFLSTGGTVKDCPVPALEKKQVAALWKDLEQFWPNLRATDSHFKFWGDEWRKHGSCSGLDPATYFGLAIQFRKAINLLAVLGTEGIVPGPKLYKPDDIKIAIENAWSTTPKVKCNIDRQEDPQLVEIVICIKTPTQQANDYNICSCRGNPITLSCVRHPHKKKILFPPVTALPKLAKYKARAEL